MFLRQSEEHFNAKVHIFHWKRREADVYVLRRSFHHL